MYVEIFMVPEDRKTLLPFINVAELTVICLEVCKYTISPVAASAAAKPFAGLLAV